MTGYLLDTNVVSELRKRERADPGVRQWFADHAESELWLSVLIIGELRRGVESIRRRDAESGDALAAWLESLIADYSDRVLPITTQIAERWAVLSVPDPVPVIDGLLAATAIEHGLTLTTRNTKDVERTGVALVNPFGT